MPIRTKHKTGRNEKCPCESGLKFKRCHGDMAKVIVCNEAANQKMVELIRIEQRKQIVAMQQKECIECGGSGFDNGAKCRCQYVTEEEYVAETYKQKSEKINLGEKKNA